MLDFFSLFVSFWNCLSTNRGSILMICSLCLAWICIFLFLFSLRMLNVQFIFFPKWQHLFLTPPPSHQLIPSCTTLYCGKKVPGNSGIWCLDTFVFPQERLLEKRTGLKYSLQWNPIFWYSALSGSWMTCNWSFHNVQVKAATFFLVLCDCFASFILCYNLWLLHFWNCDVIFHSAEHPNLVMWR